MTFEASVAETAALHSNYSQPTLVRAVLAFPLVGVSFFGIRVLILALPPILQLLAGQTRAAGYAVHQPANSEEWIAPRIFVKFKNSAK